MAKDDQQEAYERILASTLLRTIDFLKFAETKNAALITLSSAWMLGSVNLLNGTNPSTEGWRIGLICALPLFAAAAAIGLISLLPITILSMFQEKADGDKALLYFGGAAEFAPAAYISRFRERYFPPPETSATVNYLDDLAVQIAVNSQIVRRKLRCFHVGALVILAAILILAVSTIVI